MRVLFFSNLFFFLSLILVLYAQPLNNEITGDETSAVGANNNNGNGQRFSFENARGTLSRNARRKRDFQHGFNKK